MINEVLGKLDQYVAFIIEHLLNFVNWVEVLMNENVGMFFGVILIIGFVALLVLIGLIVFMRKAFKLFLFLAILIAIYVCVSMFM